MNDNDMRDALYRAVYEDFVGPTDQESEEITKWSNLKQAYSAGVLYPLGAMLAEVADDEGLDEPSDEPLKGGQAPSDIKSYSLADEDEPIALSNAEYQSAISLTVCVRLYDKLNITIRAGKYVSNDSGSGYKRIPITYQFDDIPLPSPERNRISLDVPETKLSMLFVYRYQVDDSIILSAALRNTKKSENPRNSAVSDCYFQCSFELVSKNGFEPIPRRDNPLSIVSAEELSNRLIYSEIKNYAIGHGCAADWSAETPLPRTIVTKTMPLAEVYPTLFNVKKLEGVSFDMHMLSDPARWDEALPSLTRLCDEYDQWITSLDSEAQSFKGWHAEAAAANIAQCRHCLNRMRSGVATLESDARARSAFHLTNEAMLSQYLHYCVVANEYDAIRDSEDGQRSWRPFQIAFLIMNIDSMVSTSAPERSELDLIWFPTGGGKTEAYLGLSAFTLVFERLCGESCKGTSIIMRYTLRLLSSQQFTRASSLICALEMMRQRQPELLGDTRFTIGFWVGSSAAPNDWDTAVKIAKDLANGKKSGDALPITQCPWCGSPMGEKGKGYKQVRNKESSRIGKYYLKFICPNDECDFGRPENDLPLKVVDDEIYFAPPSLLLGTVDKFAMIPYRPGSYRIFGIDSDGKRFHAPKLIIQDELHLISGPLGSMVGHYETLVDELCTDRRGNTSVKAKIIASTATVSRAREQCHELFGTPTTSVNQFPAAGLRHSDSFFARLSQGERGRRYVGVYVPNLSFATASIRLYTQLLNEPKTWELEDDASRDPYWTVVGYYSSTRELGQALTWTSSDIPERLYEQYRKHPGREGRRLSNVVELTGRKGAPEVKQGLESLTIRYPERNAVDICLATNMISVGLDIPRLGVMMMAGQPKQTSEYIQATSRVGRGDAKGIVFVLYGTTRPRDRSHYEGFKNYHESFYQHVEPSSITPFCEQVRDRAMPGTIFGLQRAKAPDAVSANIESPNAVADIRGLIEARISAIDDSECADALNKFDSITDYWASQDYSRWENLKPEPFAEDDAPLPLMHPRRGKTNPEWGNSSFEVPTSMRSVGDECKVSVIGRYPLSSQEGEQHDVL